MSKINILLPFKEKFSENVMSSVSISVKANIEKSSFKNKIKIFGQFVDDPIFKDNFVGIKKPYFPFLSKNINLAKKMCAEINRSKTKKPVIEIHNRPYLVKYVNENIIESRIILFFHNDPLEMKGSKTVQDRLNLIHDCAAICFVSNYIKNRFMTDIESNPNNLSVIYNGINKVPKFSLKKEKEILFIGRLVEEKGAHLFVEAAKILSKKYQKWNFTLIGSPYLGNIKKETKYSKKISSAVDKLGLNVRMTGYLPHNDVLIHIRRAAVIVVPSIWPEPFGLVVAEGMINGCALITSNNGGIPEIVRDKGIILKDLTLYTIVNAIELLIRDNSLRKKYQADASCDFSFTSDMSSRSLDVLRNKIILKN